MCLGVPGQIVAIKDPSTATVDVCGVQREVNISLVCKDNAEALLNAWVLIHVGFAMSIIDEEEALETQKALIAMSQLEHEVGDFLGLNQK
ncbi:hydrogenase [Pasteurellaceae bacterium 15-036681]|nr:hydrogenase [Pasteurellaceae bacterium 15-036681]